MTAVATSHEHAAPVSVSRRYLFHGTPIDLSGSWDLLDPQVDAFLKPFSVPRDEAELPGMHGSLPVSGLLRRYDQREVVRHLSPQAVRLSMPGREATPFMELFQDGERFWLVDDRWGMVELNLIKGSWRSWLLPKPALDPVRCAEMALLWPLAQVLRGRGLHLLPAVTVAREGWGVLLVSPTGLESELEALIAAGFKVLGQRWSCLREKGAAVEMIHMPGQVERWRLPKLAGPPGWIDLEQEHQGASETSARCQAVVIVESARRPVARVTELPSNLSVDALRRAWPMVELHRNRRQLSMKLATGCRCASVLLSKQPGELGKLLQTMQAPSPNADRRESSRVPSRRFVPATIRS